MNTLVTMGPPPLQFRQIALNVIQITRKLAQDGAGAVSALEFVQRYAMQNDADALARDPGCADFHPDPPSAFG
jgi:hypothetical protein